jgi:hypothetical protein
VCIPPEDDPEIGSKHVVGKNKNTINTMVTGGSFSGVQRPRREAKHSPPTSAGSRKRGHIHPHPHTPSLRIA